MTGIDKEVVQDKESALKYMKKRNWIVDDSIITTVLMADICRNAAEKPSVSQEIKNMLRAFSFALESASVDPILDSFNKAATAKLESLIDAAHQKLNKSIESTTKHLDAVSLKYGELTITATEAAKALKNAPAQRSYSQVLAQSRNPTAFIMDDAKATNIVNVRERQVLVSTTQKIKRNTGVYTREEVTGYKEKLNEAMGKMEEAGKKGWRIADLRITRTGTTLLEMSTKEAAEWIRSEDNWTSISKEAYGDAEDNTRVVPRTCDMMIRFVPVGWTPHETDALRTFETDNSIPTNSILAASWIKNPANRYNGQAFANVKMVCTSPEIANRLILGPTRICEHTVAVQKERKTIPICVKCSQFDHFIAKCNSDKFICRHCAQEHSSRDCTDKRRTMCTPCGSRNHSSGDERCIEYRHRREKLEIKAPEIRARFFFTKDKWTYNETFTAPWNTGSLQTTEEESGDMLEEEQHEQAAGTAEASSASRQQPTPGTGNLRQSTLKFGIGIPSQVSRSIQQRPVPPRPETAKKPATTLDPSQQSQQSATSTPDATLSALVSNTPSSLGSSQTQTQPATSNDTQPTNSSV